MLGKWLIHAVLLLALFNTGAGLVAAAPYGSGYYAPRVAKKQGVSLEQAVAQVKQETKGRILTAETVNRKGRLTHRIKVLLPNGKVRVMHVDAE